MKYTYTLEELPEIAGKILSDTAHKTLLFYGEMGVGKTTLIKELAKKLGVTDTINSPTYAIVNEYHTEADTLYHFDFYRVKNEEEAMDIGVEDYLESGHWNFVEWPQNAQNLTPQNAVEVHLSVLENGERNIQLKLKS